MAEERHMGSFLFISVTAAFIWMQSFPSISKIDPKSHTAQSAKKQTSKFDKIKCWLDTWVNSGAFPHAIVSVHHKGNEVFFHAASGSGTASQVNRDTIFRIYSMTKPITGLGIIILMERGLLAVDDFVEKYLVEFSGQPVYASGDAESIKSVPLSEKLRIHHLLTHTSGITYALFGNHPCDTLIRQAVPNDDFRNLFCNTNLEDLSKYVASVPLCFQPGTKFHYGLSTDILGLIIEKVSGKSLDEFFKSEIFEPLGMQDTSFVIPPEKAHRLAECYEATSSFGVKVSTGVERNRLEPRPLLSGGGGLVSTIDDYALFAKFLLKKGLTENGRRLVRSSSIEKMTTNHLPPGEDLGSFAFDKSFSEAYGNGIGFGYCMSVVTNPSIAAGAGLSGVGEFGWGGVASTFFFIDPVNDLISILMTQLIPSSKYPIRQQLRWLAHWLVRDDLE